MNLFHVSWFHHFLSPCAQTVTESAFSEGSQPEEHDEYCMVCLEVPFYKVIVLDKKKKKNNMCFKWKYLLNVFRACKARH